MRYLTLLLLLPALLWAQEFQFQQETDTIPVEINGWQPYQPFFGGFSWSTPCFCDIDSDEDLDLYVGIEVNAPIPFFRNIGNSMTPNFSWQTGLNDSMKSVDDFGHTNPDFFDLDGDGDLDCLVGSGYVTFVRNFGTAIQPNFNSPRDTLFDTVRNPVFGTRVALVDIDADQDEDLICGEYQGYLRLYRNVGTPDSFAFFLEQDHWLGISVGSGGYADPTLCDIDADGDFDLFIGEEWGKIWFYRNDGTAQQYNFTYVTNNYAGIDVGDYSSPEFADIDGDGDYDLFIGREQQPVTIDPGDMFYYENIGTPQMARWNLVTKNYLCLDEGYSARSATTDIDGDGDLDLFIQNAGDRLSYYENIGTLDSAAFRWVTDSYQDISVNDAHPKFADIDADQDPDLFLGQAILPNPPYPGLYLYKNLGTPQNASFTLFSSNLVPGNYIVSLAPSLADIDADGDQDLFLSNADDYYFFRNVGSPTQASFQQITSSWQNISPGVTSASCFYDIDQDGDLDLFMTPWNDWNQVWFYRNIGNLHNAIMIRETQQFLPFEGLHIPEGIDVFDIDNDGDGDFLLSMDIGGMMFFRNVTGQSPVDPRKRPEGPPLPKIDLVLQPGEHSTTISFALPSPQHVSLAVYNILGGRVATLVQGLQPVGNQVYRWQPLNAPSGVYLVRLATPTAATVKKLAVVK